MIKILKNKELMLNRKRSIIGRKTWIFNKGSSEVVSHVSVSIQHTAEASVEWGGDDRLQQVPRRLVEKLDDTFLQIAACRQRSWQRKAVLIQVALMHVIRCVRADTFHP